MTFANIEDLHQRLIDFRSDVGADAPGVSLIIYADEEVSTMHVKGHRDCYGDTWDDILKVNIHDDKTLEDLLPTLEFDL